MRKLSLIKQLLIGLLLGIIMTPAQPAQAQWTVFDPTSYAAQIEEMAREMDRWMQTVQHYTAMYDKAVKQVTSLGGILTIVDQQLARNKSLISSVAQIGQTVRHIYLLRRQIENMVACRIRAIQQLDSRLKAGIFNPQQDLQDLEEYLSNSIGRSSQNTLANL
jgi:uncharacterized UPF0160 family protein